MEDKHFTTKNLVASAATYNREKLCVDIVAAQLQNLMETELD